MRRDLRPGRRPVVEMSTPLGRVFEVVRETWHLSADPRATPPTCELVASDRSASDAADLARRAAGAHSRHGFHKPSRAWWAVSGAEFHRFVVRPRRRAPSILVVGLGIAGLAALTTFGLSGRRRGPVRRS
jgi:hypothetical protein